MIRRPPRSTRTDTLFPYTTLFRSALVGIEDFWLAEARQRFLQRRHAKAGIPGVRQSPGQNLAARPVHHAHQIQETLSHRAVRHIGPPNMVGPLDRQLAPQIGTDPVSRMRSARSRAWVARPPTQPPH